MRNDLYACRGVLVKNTLNSCASHRESFKYNVFCLPEDGALKHSQQFHLLNAMIDCKWVSLKTRQNKIYKQIAKAQLHTNIQILHSKKLA